MARYCVVASLNTEWIVTNALDEQQCSLQGGVIVERGTTGGCGSSLTAYHSYEGLSESGIAGPTSALALVPLRLFRTTFAQSALMTQLEQLNTLAADEVEHIFAADAALGEKVSDAFLKISLLVSAFFGNSDESLAQISYTQELHDGLAETANAMAQHTKNRKFRTALKDIVKTTEQFVGKNLLDIQATLKEPDSAA